MNLPELLERLADVVKGHVARAQDALNARITELEAKIAAVPAGKDGAPGKDADAIVIAAMVDSAVARAVAVLPKARDGKDVEPSVLKEMISTEVSLALATLPKPRDGRDGRDVDPEVLRQIIEAASVKAVEALPKPRDGRDGKDGVDAKVDEKLLGDMVALAVAQIPTPKDGKDGAPGASILAGEGPPLFSGREGDLYLDVRSGEVYKFKS